MTEPSVKLSFSDHSIIASQKLETRSELCQPAIQFMLQKWQTASCKDFQNTKHCTQNNQTWRKTFSLSLTPHQVCSPSGSVFAWHITSFPPCCLVSCTDTELQKHYHLPPDNSSYRNKGHKSRLRDTSIFQTAGVQAKGRHQQHLFRIPLFKKHIQIHRASGRQVGFCSGVTINILGNKIIIKRYSVQDQPHKVFQSR